MRRSSDSHHDNHKPNYDHSFNFEQTEFASYHHPQANLISEHIQQIGSCIGSKDFHQAEMHLSFITHKLSPALTSEDVKWLLNKQTQFSPDLTQNSILEQLIIQEAPPITLSKFFLYGVSDHYFYTVVDSFIPNSKEENASVINREYEGCNLVHLAAKELNVVALQALSECNIDFNLKNANGLTPLTLVMEIYLVNIHQSSRKTLDNVISLLIDNIDPSAKHFTSEHPFCFALQRYDLDLAEEILNNVTATPIGTESARFIIIKNGIEESVDFHGIAREVLKLGFQIQSTIPEYDNKPALELIYEGCNFYRLSANIQYFYYYLQSYLEMTNQTEVHEDRSFNKLAIAITNSYSPQDIESLLANVEAYHDEVFEQNDRMFSPDYHQNEAELLLLLAHPEFIHNFNPKHASSITKVLTSPYRFMDYNVQTIDLVDGGWKTISNWQRIGQLTNSFLNWRFDSLHPQDQVTENKLPALIEDFGFTKCQLSLETNQKYGSCYQIKPNECSLNFISRDQEMESFLTYNPKAIFFLARGYMMMSDPSLGTLLIRNSSLIFGRNTMHHPAYYSPEFINTPIIDNQYENLYPILSRRINGVNDGVIPGKQHRDEIRYLTEEITGIFDSYNRWKFNTDPQTSFRKTNTTITNNEIIGAYNSVGFESLVRNIRATYETGKQTKNPKLIPSLAMTHRYSPPWNSFAYDKFVPDTGGTILQRKFEIDDYNLEVMESLAQGEYNLRDFRNSSLQSFFQTGINFQANLTIVSSK